MLISSTYRHVVSYECALSADSARVCTYQILIIYTDQEVFEPFIFLINYKIIVYSLLNKI